MMITGSTDNRSLLPSKPRHFAAHEPEVEHLIDLS